MWRLVNAAGSVEVAKGKPSIHIRAEESAFNEHWQSMFNHPPSPGQTVRRGIFRNVPDLQQAIGEFTAAWSAHPKPFVWTASVEAIMQKIAKRRRRLEEIHPGSTKPRDPYISIVICRIPH